MDADEVLVLDIAAASETPIEGIHATLITDRMAQGGHTNVRHFPDRPAVVRELPDSARPGAHLLTTGAGDGYPIAQ